MTGASLRKYVGTVTLARDGRPPYDRPSEPTRYSRILVHEPGIHSRLL